MHNQQENFVYTTIFGCTVTVKFFFFVFLCVNHKNDESSVFKRHINSISERERYHMYNILVYFYCRKVPHTTPLFP